MRFLSFFGGTCLLLSLLSWRSGFTLGLAIVIPYWLIAFSTRMVFFNPDNLPLARNRLWTRLHIWFLRSMHRNMPAEVWKTLFPDSKTRDVAVPLLVERNSEIQMSILHTFYRNHNWFFSRFTLAQDIRRSERGEQLLPKGKELCEDFKRIFDSIVDRELRRNPKFHELSSEQQISVRDETVENLGREVQFLLLFSPFPWL